MLKIRTDVNPPEIYLYGEIGPDYWGLIDSQSVINGLDAIGNVPQIAVRINSPGGDVFEAMAIYNALARHQASIISEIDALAASAAAVVAMAGDRIRIAANAFMMIHRAWTIAMGNAEELGKIVELLKKIDGSIVDVFDARTGDRSTRQDIEAWMEAETWMNAEEAVARGFADETGQELQVPPAMPAGRFRNVPPQLARQASSRQSMATAERSRELPSVAAVQRAKIALTRARTAQ